MESNVDDGDNLGRSKITECSMEDDTEDYIQPSQPLNFQTCANSGPICKRILNDTETARTDTAALDDTVSFHQAVISTPPGEISNDFIPTTENPIKRKMDTLDMDDTCKKRLNLDDSNIVKPTSDMFATNSQLNDTVDVAQLKVLESPSPSRNTSLVPETPLHINETIESENGDAIFPEKLGVLEDTFADDSLNGYILNSSKNENPESSIDKIQESKDTSKCDSSRQLLDSSGVSSLLRDTTEEVMNEKIKTSEAHLDDTVDVDEMEYCNSFSSGAGNGKIKPTPPLTEIEMVVKQNRESIPADAKNQADEFRFKGVLKTMSEEEMAKLQKHSTPENSLSKSLKINESTSSIENGTPPVQEDIKCNDITFTMYLQVNCHVVTDAVAQKCVSKKITSVKELMKRQPRTTLLEPYSDSSCKTKRLSSSSYGSVYSDKTELPYSLPSRPSPLSVATQSSSSSVDLTKHIQIVEREVWQNEYMLPMAMDDILPRYVEENKRKAQGLDSKQNGKRKTSIRLRKKSHWSHPLDNVLESSLTEQSSGNNSDVQLKSINKSEGLENVENIDDKLVSAISEEDEKATEQENVKLMSPEEKEDDSSMSEGRLVFARWTDKRYYPGELKCRAKYDRWEVYFDDETGKVVREDMILPLNWLTKGELVFALVGEKYMSGKIAEIIREEEIKFRIELDDTNEEVFVKKSDICLNDVMAGIIREKFKPTNKSVIPATSCDIDFDNVVTGKRVREQRTPIRTPTIALQSSSSTAKKRRLIASVDGCKTTETPMQKSVPEKTRSSKTPRISHTGQQNEITDVTAKVTPRTKSEAKRRGRTLNYDSSTSTKKLKRENNGDSEVTTAEKQRRSKSSAKSLINEFDEVENKKEENVQTKQKKSKEESPVKGRVTGRKTVQSSQKRRRKKNP